MDNYNPRQPTRFRFKDSREIEKFKFFTGDYDFDEHELLENISQDKRYGPIIEAFKESIRTNRDIGVILYDGPGAQNTYIGFIVREVGYLYTISTSSIFIINLEYDNQRDTLSITNTTEDILVADNVKTLFGQDIVGTGDINLYRHQMTITNANDVSVVYIVNASNNSVINTIEKFVEVTKANTNYTGLASYLDADGNVNPAFIRYTAGNVVIQLRNGSISPMKSVSDIVTPI